MIKIIHFFVRQRLFINLTVFIVGLVGAVTIYNLNREAFPNVNFDMMTVTTLYTGASPDDIEQLVSIPIEKKLREVNGLDKVRSYNLENISVIVINLDPDESDKQRIVDNVKDSVELVNNLPTNAEKPVVQEIRFDKTPAIDIAITSNDTGLEAYRTLRSLAKGLEDDLYDMDGVAEVKRYSYFEREFLIEVSPQKAAASRIGINTLLPKLYLRNVDLPGGALRIGDKEYIVRTKGQFKDIEEIKNVVVSANDFGYVTRIKDIANVSDTFEEAKKLERFNEKNAIILKVSKKESADMITITDQIKAYLKNSNKSRAKEIQVKYFNDYSRFVRSRLSALVINGLTGLALLVAILIILLGFRMSLIVGVSIPVTFMVAFIGMQLAGITINIISMFALVMVLGMIVDFAIVVAENSYRHLEDGWGKIEAVERGTAEVFWPVTTTLLCIAAAFGPLLFMTGVVGKFVVAIPIVIMLCLAASWFAAMFILPNHIETFAKVTAKKNKDKADGFQKIQNYYKRFLDFVLRHRYATVGLLILSFVGSIVLTAFFLGFVFFPGGGGEALLIRTKMPLGSTLEANKRELAKLEKVVAYIDKSELESMHTRIGVEIEDLINPAPTEATHRGTVILNLTPTNDRKRSATEILREMRDKVGKAVASGEVSKDLKLDLRVRSSGPPVGLPINVEIRGKDFGIMTKIANEYIKFLKTVDGVFDVTTDLEPGKEEYRYVIDEAVAARTNVSMLDVAQVLHTAFDGTIATYVNKGDDEIAVRVRFPEEARGQRRTLQRLKVANTKGGLIPLHLITKYEKKPGFSSINRLNFKRVAQIQANVDVTKITSLEANQKLKRQFSDIEKKYPGYDINYGGEEEDRKKSMANLMMLFGFALLIIYLIIASFFKSLILPIVVMSAIPFALVGVVIALLAHIEPLSFMSLLGIFSLAGVIVSNTLVLVQFINNLRNEGLALKEALVEGGAMRLRPVILTSGTTVLGLFPTIYGLGGEDAFVAPLALAFGYGLIFATFITLILIPAFYHIAEDFKGGLVKFASWFGYNLPSTLYSKPKEDEKN